jgi:hypothetical protein
VHGSDGYIVEQHPVAITVAVIVLLYVVWLVLRLRR